jgi:hypothetical protein
MISNATARALVNNMGMASGPQVGIKTDRLAAGETDHPAAAVEDLADDSRTPWPSSTDPAIEFFQPDSHAPS